MSRLLGNEATLQSRSGQGFSRPARRQGALGSRHHITNQLPHHGGFTRYGHGNTAECVGLELRHRRGEAALHSDHGAAWGVAVIWQR